MGREFIYIPDDRLNIDPLNPDLVHYNFTGLPCPKESVVDAIGLEGVDTIDRRIKEMIEWKISLFGKDSTKIRFEPLLYFFDKNDIDCCITCSSPIIILPTSKKKIEQQKSLFYYPDRTLNKNNYSMAIKEVSGLLRDKITQIIKQHK